MMRGAMVLSHSSVEKRTPSWRVIAWDGAAAAAN